MAGISSFVLSMGDMRARLHLSQVLTADGSTG